MRLNFEKAIYCICFFQMRIYLKQIILRLIKAIETKTNDEKPQINELYSLDSSEHYILTYIFHVIMDR